MEKAGGFMCFEAMRMREITKYIGRDDILIVDLRERSEYFRGHVKGARNFPYDDTIDIREWCAKVKQMIRLYEDRRRIRVMKVFVYCGRGNISLFVARDLNKECGNIYNLYGGYNAYRGPLERTCIE